MKWLFLLLLTINLGIFAWGYQREQIETAHPIAAGSDVGDMRLLSEARPEPDPDPVTSELTPEFVPEVASLETEATPGETSLDEAAQTDTAGLQDEPSVALGLPESGPPAQPRTDDEIVPEAAAETEIDTAVEPAAEPVVETETTEQPGQETLVETGEATAPEDGVEPSTVAVADTATEAETEVTATNTPTESETEPEKPEQQLAAVDSEVQAPSSLLERPVAEGGPAPPKPKITRRCGTIGPLKDRKVAKEVVAGLKESGFEAKLERRVEKMQIGFWVVIPPLSDGSQAQAKIDELSRAGLKDIWHFRGGGLKNAISLGMFSKRENAEKYSREVLAKGFVTKIQPRYLNKNNYLVNFAISSPRPVTSMSWRMVEEKYSKMPFSEQSCEPIATR
jgi:hypothetical protein